MDFFEKKSLAVVTGASLALICVVSLLDYWTGYELSFSIFYLIPISLLAWYRGRKAGLAISVVAAAAWLVADALAGRVYSDPAIPYWNMLVRFGFFVVVTMMLSALRTAQARQEEWTQFIVHDLRNPLSNTMIGLETLEQLQQSSQRSAERTLVTTCLISCRRMVVLINALLDQSRLERARMPLALEAIDVRELLQASFEEVSIWAANEAVALQSEVENAALFVSADREMSKRVLVNLLSNAIKFSPVDSAVVVQVAAANDGDVLFRVIDQGRGIPAEWTSRIFDKFAQVNAGKSNSAHGSGLGLSFCRAAVLAQGGGIWIEETGEQGTTIAFTLPRQVV